MDRSGYMDENIRSGLFIQDQLFSRDTVFGFNVHKINSVRLIFKTEFYTFRRNNIVRKTFNFFANHVLNNTVCLENAECRKINIYVSM